jgi:hypothetical protein
MHRPYLSPDFSEHGKQPAPAVDFDDEKVDDLNSGESDHADVGVETIAIAIAASPVASSNENGGGSGGASSAGAPTHGSISSEQEVASRAQSARIDEATSSAASSQPSETPQASESESDAPQFGPPLCAIDLMRSPSNASTSSHTDSRRDAIDDDRDALSDDGPGSDRLVRGYPHTAYHFATPMLDALPFVVDLEGMCEN